MASGGLSRQQVERQREMLANRLKKRARQLAPAFVRQGVEAYRLYDWDIPEIRLVVDWYAGHLVLAEYEREQTRRTPGWLDAMARGAAEALKVPPERTHLKRRHTGGAGGARYERLERIGERIEVREGPLKFWVNLDDYIDTGLFTDHRITRSRVAREARGARFLNLFCYTGSFTCAAALGGASTTTSVDLSGRYLDWTKDNLALNGLAGPQHEVVRGDAVRFLETVRERYSLIVLDPPSRSTVGGGDGLDVQRDQGDLIRLALRALTPGGVLYFSVNHQRFSPTFDEPAEELTSETVPPDHRNRHAHRCWRFVR